MKRKIIIKSLSLGATGTLLLFISGLLWALVPVGGSTLPRWLEKIAGVSFIASAMLVSLLLAISCVGSNILAYILLLLEKNNTPSVSSG